MDLVTALDELPEAHAGVLRLHRARPTMRGSPPSLASMSKRGWQGQAFYRSPWAPTTKGDQDDCTGSRYLSTRPARERATGPEGTTTTWSGKCSRGNGCSANVDLQRAA